LSKIEVRKAKLDELPILYKFEQAIIEAERPYGDSIKENTNYYDIREMILSDKVMVCVATDGDVIVSSGYAKIVPSKLYHTHDQYVYCGFMYTIPEYRGLGINQMVIEFLKKWTLENGLNEMRLNVYLDNLSAINAYRKAGFTHNILEMRYPL
jgi:GNAT superfamily N-acetyltransferase